MRAKKKRTVGVKDLHSVELYMFRFRRPRPVISTTGQIAQKCTYFQLQCKTLETHLSILEIRVESTTVLAARGQSSKSSLLSVFVVGVRSERNESVRPPAKLTHNITATP